jgi:hypothetical protein
MFVLLSNCDLLDLCPKDIIAQLIHYIYAIFRASMDVFERLLQLSLEIALSEPKQSFTNFLLQALSEPKQSFTNFLLQADNHQSHTAMFQQLVVYFSYDVQQK